MSSTDAASASVVKETLSTDVASEPADKAQKKDKKTKKEQKKDKKNKKEQKDDNQEVSGTARALKAMAEVFPGEKVHMWSDTNPHVATTMNLPRDLSRRSKREAKSSMGTIDLTQM